MASIDRIYVKNNEQLDLFVKWIKAQPTLKDKYGRDCYLSDKLYDYDYGDIKKECPVFNGHYYEDAYIIRNCPFDFIQDRLKLMYGDSYDDIKNGKEYTSPICNHNYEIGRHFKLIKKEKGNWSMTLKKYSVKVRIDKYSPMLYCEGNDTWNFWDDYIKYDEDDCGICCFKSIKAIMRRIPKWKLPVGAIIKVRGRVNYVFKVLK